MLITCFQCRQQLDVPDDSAGHRVRLAQAMGSAARAGHSRSPVHVPDGTPPSERAVLVSHNEWPAVFKRIIHEYHVVGLRPQARKNR